MKIVHAYPPNIDAIKEKLNPSPNTVFTYGDTIYVPSGGHVYKDLMAHEETHMRQQGDDPKGWWDTYIASPDFRLSQEVEAYRNQYKEFSKAKNRNRLYIFLARIARDLSSSIYGGIVSYEEAFKLIRS